MFHEMRSILTSCPGSQSSHMGIRAAAEIVIGSMLFVDRKVGFVEKPGGVLIVSKYRQELTWNIGDLYIKQTKQLYVSLASALRQSSSPKTDDHLESETIVDRRPTFDRSFTDGDRMLLRLRRSTRPLLWGLCPSTSPSSRSAALTCRRHWAVSHPRNQSQMSPTWESF